MKTLGLRLYRTLVFYAFGFLWLMALVAIPSLFPSTSHGFVAAEIEPGVIELSTNLMEGLEVVSYQERLLQNTGKHWVYFCVMEKAVVHKKCFYGEKKDFPEVQEGMRLMGLKYKLRRRFKNNKNYIEIGTGRYFYPAQLLRPTV